MTVGAGATLTLGTALRAQPSSSRPPVDLVVLVAVDQMRADYLDRWPGQLTGGLGRLRAGGRVFTRAEHDHALTETAPGHATMLSGRVPAHTGIWSNDGGVEDAASPLLGAPGVTGASPRRFRGTALYDWLRARDPAALALGVSRKDRAAILPVGRAGAPGALAVWFAGGRLLTTSRYYADTLPAWVAAWNRGFDPARFAGRRWTLLLPDSAYREADGRPWENGGKDLTFPHALPDDTARVAARLERVPWMDSLTLDAALAGARARGLGRRANALAPDLLTVSLSTTDAVGHDFGPDSRALHDQVLRLDRWLGAFLDSLGTQVPAARTLVVLTADHGVSPMPERLAADGRPGARVNVAALADSVNAALRARWGMDFGVAFDNGLMTGDTAAMRARGVDPDALAERLAAQVARRPGVTRVFTPARLRAAAAGDADARRWRHTIPDGLGWLVAGVAAEGFVFSDGKKAEHGTTHPESRSVPLVFVGPGVVAGDDDRPARTVDLAPTVAALLGIVPTEPLDGRALGGLDRRSVTVPSRPRRPAGR